MEHREQYFIKKLQDCAPYFNTKPENIVSLKFRNIQHDHDYHELVHSLEMVKNVSVETIGRSLGGTAYVVSTIKQRIILVEHETGLEILYIAGSVASLIGLVLQINSMIGNYRRVNNFYPRDIEDVEVRYFDKNGRFTEEHKSSFLPYEMFLPQHENKSDIALLRKRITALERKVDTIMKKINVPKEI